MPHNKSAMKHHHPSPWAFSVDLTRVCAVQGCCGHFKRPKSGIAITQRWRSCWDVRNSKDLLRLYLGNTFWVCACVICCMFWTNTPATYISPSAQWTVKVFGRVPGIDRKDPSRNVLTVLPVADATSAMISVFLAKMNIDQRWRPWSATA